MLFRFIFQNSLQIALVIDKYSSEKIFKRNNHHSVLICDCGKLGQENYMIIVTRDAFSKRFPSTRKSRRFQIPPV